MKSERDGINPAVKRSGEIILRPEACCSSLASVGSTGARTNPTGAFKLANTASRIGGAPRSAAPFDCLAVTLQ